MLGRRMLAEDNPGELWVSRGKDLWHAARGPLQRSLEGCDLGRGAGVVDGAFAQLPRYFPDTGLVQDMESRLLTCMTVLHGLDRAQLIRAAFSTLERASDLEALSAYVASRSNGLPMDPPLARPEERAALAAGAALFNRRSGPLDFSCATCHQQDDRRIRLQELTNLRDNKQARAVVASWPAYRGTHGTLRTMQHRLYDCVWQMRLPELAYASEMSVALTSYLNHQGRGAVIQVPGVVR
jgi:sulfur-oxidizing protein SoxA